jgi:hypothetical protein
MDSIDIKFIIFISATFATFVTSVMGEKQNDRLRNGSFGAVAGSSVGGISALLKSQNELIIFGFAGSAAGAFLGWFTYLLSFMASKEWGQRLLIYHVGGIKSVLEQIKDNDEKLIKDAIDKWRQSFSTLMTKHSSAISLIEIGDNNFPTFKTP